MASISTLVDRVKIVVLSTGVGPFTLGNSVRAFRGKEALTDGATYSYAVESGSDYEVGTGIYVASSSQMVRSPKYSSNSNAVVSFPSNVEVAFTLLAADVDPEGTSLTVVQVPGVSPSVVMSQKAVTQSLSSKIDDGELNPPAGAGVVGFGHAAPYISKTVGDRLSKTVYVTDDDFNATPDGPYCTTALQRAFNSGASKIILPSLRAGQNYRIEGTLGISSQLEICGQNRWATGIVSDDLDAPIFYGDGVQNFTSKDLRLAYNGTPLIGADAILLEDSFVCQINHMWFNNTYNGVRFEGGGNANILDYRSFGYKGAGLMVSNAIDINMVAFRMSANDSINGLNGGIYLVGGVEAFVATAGDITLGQHGIVTAGVGASTARGQSPWHNKIIGVYFDSARFQGAYMRQATDFQFHNSWIASAGHDEAVGFGSAEDYSGLDASQCTHLLFNGGELYNNGGRGALIYPDCKHTSIIGRPLVARNQYTRTADGAGVEFLAGTTDFVCEINAIRDPDTTTYRQTDAVRIAPGASDRYEVRALLGGCSAFDGGSGTNKTFGPNY